MRYRKIPLDDLAPELWQFFQNTGSEPVTLEYRGRSVGVFYPTKPSAKIDFSKVDQLPGEFVIGSYDPRIPPLVFKRLKDVGGVMYKAVLPRRPRGER